MVTDEQMIARHAAQIDEVVAARLRRRQQPVKLFEMVTRWVGGDVTSVYDEDPDQLIDRAEYLIKYAAVQEIQIPAIGFVVTRLP